MGTSVLVGTLTGIGASIVTVLLTPWLQHHFWKRQKRFELQFATFEAVNSLFGEFVVMVRGMSNVDMNDIFRRVTELRPRVNLLFGSPASSAFLEAHRYIVEAQPWDVTQFVLRSDDAQRALLQEMGFVKCR